MMEIRSFRSILLTAIVYLCACASSADIETLGPRPETIPLDPESPAKLQPRRCFVVHADVPFLAKPASNAAVVGTAEFLKYGFVVRAKQLGDATYYLLATAVNENAEPIRIRELLGWIDRRYCLDFVSSGGPEARKDSYTLIHRKCILINSITKLPDNADVDLLAPEVAFFGRPSTDKAFYRTEHRLFGIYYIYDENDTHFFVGNRPNCRRGDREEVLLGWIDKRWTLEWNTREALEFNKQDIARRTCEAIIFSDCESLKRYLDTDEISRVLAREDLRDTRPPEYYDLRYPVLYDVRTRQDIQGTPIYKIGIIGPVLGPGRRQILTKNEVDRMREELLQLKEASSKIQVHFVVIVKPNFGRCRCECNAVFGMKGRLGRGERVVNSYREREAVWVGAHESCRSRLASSGRS